MTNQIFIQVSSQIAPDTGRSTVFGVLNYVATGVYMQPTQQCVYDYGITDDNTAMPFPVFTGDTSARAYYDSIAGAALISAANTFMGSSYYTTYDIETVDSPVYADFSSLAVVAKTGDYSDLTGTPAIPEAQVNSDWESVGGLAKILNKPLLSAVATSGAYSDLTGTPTLATVATSGVYSDLTGKPTLSAVATSGSYSDLSGKPSIPSAQVNSDWNASSGVSQILNKPSLPVVQAYEGVTQRLGAFPIFAHATVSSGVAVFNLTNDGTSSGTALFPNGVIADSVNLFVSDATASYQMSVAWSNGNKTLTVTTNKLTTANLLTGLLGQVAANSAVVKLQVWVY